MARQHASVHADVQANVPARRPAGFTLVELLVVLGLIGVLLSLLLPTLSSARRRAEELQCQANLRTIGQAFVLHETVHGYYPLAGWHWDPVGGVVNPEGMGDPDARRYTYYTDAGERRPAPTTVALALSLGVNVDTGSRPALEADMQTDAVRKHFTCPSQEPLLTGITQCSSEGWKSPPEWSSYVFNEALLGRREQARWPDCPVGKSTRVRNPSDVLMAMDGRPRGQVLDNFLLPTDRGRSDTLLDFNRYVMSPENQTYGTELLDYLRHRWRANVLFVDGHVEAVELTDGGLDRVGLSKGIGG